MSGRRAIVHIGMPKSGSSSIQSFLAGNGKRIRQQGFYYPAIFGLPGQQRLALYAKDLREQDGTRQRRNLHSRFRIDSQADLTSFRTDLEQRLDSDLKALDPAVHTVFFSAVQLYGLTPGEIGRLKALLEPHFDEIRILVYFRRQDEVLISSVTTALIHGSTLRARDLFTELSSSYELDYDLVADRWAEAFGRDAMMVRLYGDKNMLSGDMISTLCETVGLQDAEDLVRPPRMNASINAEGQALLRMMNKARPPGNTDAALAGRERFIAYLREVHAGQGERPGYLHRRHLLERYRDNNEKLRASWFPERTSLFAEPTPADGGPVPGKALPTGEAAMVLVDEICRAWAKDLTRLEGERALLEGMTRIKPRGKKVAGEQVPRGLQVELDIARRLLRDGDLDGAAAHLSAIEASAGTLPEAMDRHFKAAQRKLRRRKRALDSVDKEKAPTAP